MTPKSMQYIIVCSLHVLSKGLPLFLQLEIGSLEALCVQYIESSICQENVLVALDSAARLQLDPLKV